MERSLAIFAHAHDEVLGFSTVLEGAGAILVTDLGAPAGTFEEAAAAFGALSTTRLRIPAVAGWRLPAAALREELRRIAAAMPERTRVYTHDPLDENPHHHGVALAAADAFGEVWVPARGAAGAEVRVLGEGELARKLSVLDRVYAPHHPHPSHPEDRGPPIACELHARDVLAVESFARATRGQVARAASLTHYDLVLSEAPDTWAFGSSSYERERFDAAIALMSEPGAGEPRSILELGACEGMMTAEILAAFPGATVTALEPNPDFASRLTARLGRDPRLVWTGEPLEIAPLEADLVVACEVLYYVAARAPEVVARIRARRLVTSHHGVFEERLASILGQLGWRERSRARLPIRLESIGPFVVRRVGCTVRSWER